MKYEKKFISSFFVVNFGMKEKSDDFFIYFLILQEKSPDEDGTETSEMEKIVSAFCNQRMPLDSTDGFCLMFADLLRQLPDEVRSTAEMEIWQKLLKLVEEQKKDRQDN